jgi:hypothetical protein
LTTPTVSLASPSDLTTNSSAIPQTSSEQSNIAGRLSNRQKAKFVQWVTDAYREGRSARVANERQWYLNLAFYAGRQNVEFFRQRTSQLGAQLRVPEAPPWRVRLVINRIRPVVRKEIAKLTSQKPQFVAVPATSDDSDLAASRAAEQLLDSMWNDLKLARTVRQAIWWEAICGTSFLKDWWDPNCGPPGPDGRPIGDIKVEAVDPFHLVVGDIREPELDSQPWVMHATTHPREWVKRNLGKDVSTKATVAATQAIMEDVLTGQYTPRPTQQVLCLETWLRPGVHPDLSEGGLITIVGDQLVHVCDYSTDGPVFDHGEMPFTKLDHIPMGRFYSDSSITDLVPLQRELNRTRSQIVEIKNMTSKPKYMAPENSVDATAITSEPGQVIFYKFGLGKPEVIEPPSLPGYVIEAIQELRSDFDDVSGQHQISRGFAPSHTAASAIAFLQEQDDTLLAYTTASLEEGIARLGTHCLSHVRQFWDTPRVVRTVGSDGVFDAILFQASDLRGISDVRVQSGSSLPMSKAARSATLLDLYSKGAFGNPTDPAAGAKLLAALDLGGVDKAMEDWQADRRQVDRENILMSKGVQVTVNPYDNDAAHIAGHQRFQKGQEYQALPPQLQQVFDMHVAEHQQKLAMAMQLSSQLSAPGGMPPGPGAPSNPNSPGGGLPSGPGPNLPGAGPAPSSGPHPS